MRHWVESHGHFLTRNEVAELTGLAVAEVAGNPAFVAWPGWSTEETYPAAQFHADGRPTPGVEDLMSALGDEADHGDLIAFLTTSLPALGGQTPFGWLQAGGEVHRVIKQAAR